MATGAVILAAGGGTRLRSAAPIKPLAEVHGRPLLTHAFAALAAAGVGRATVVTGHGADAVVALCHHAPFPVETRHNARWADAPNGVSLLAAGDDVAGATILMMADHLVAPGLVHELVTDARAEAALTLAVDRRLGHPWIDEADVTRVRTEGRRIRAIGKDIPVYDCYDCGVFLITPRLIETLRGLADPSLSEGVARLAGEGVAEIADCTRHDWLDVDDGRALAIAQEYWVDA